MAPDASQSEDSSPKRPGWVYTFYSYKGGVGRSMALANVAVLLAQRGKRVLIVDWDLEAPGLERFFQPADESDVRAKAISLSRDPIKTPGILDLIEANADGESAPLDWHECVIQAQIRDSAQPVSILTAGSPENYLERLQAIHWDDHFKNHHLGRYLDSMRQEWLSRFDMVLIDSRTGISDIGGICTILMPDVLVLMFTSSGQSLDGLAKVALRARAAQSRLPMDRARLLAVPICGRDESRSEYDEQMRWRGRIAEKLQDFYQDWLVKGVKPREVLDRLYIPYWPRWSFGDALPVVQNPDEMRDPASLSAAYERLAALIDGGLDWSAVGRGPDPRELAEARSQKEQLQRELNQRKRKERIQRVAVTAIVTAIFVAVVGWNVHLWFTSDTRARAALKDAGAVLKYDESGANLLVEFDATFILGTEATHGYLADLKYLFRIRLSGGGMRLLKAVSGLPRLQSLDLSSTEVTDLTPLRGLSGLQSLYLNETPVSDLTALANLSGLQSLDLYETPVSDLTPLAGLRGLQTLDLRFTQVSDLTPLAGLSGLQKLYLSGTPVSDLAPLAGLSGLQSLNLWGTQVSDLTALKDLSGLQSLDLTSTQVSDLTPLAGLSGLQSLDLWGTPVSDLTPLAGLSGLQWLDLRYCKQVSDLTPLARLTGLRTLHIHVMDVSALEHLKNLEILFVP